ncbi:MAG: hypothetical protein HKN93_04510, partial [Acidimicrobiia bacterium]|nr:hypothetical protein [Acidimicrobiia bacterium]
MDLLDLDGEGLMVHTISAHRGARNERIDTGAIRVAGDYYFQVTGYNGAASKDPYSFRMKVVLPGDVPVCAAPGLSGGTPGSSSLIPTDVNTLFLVNRQRLEAAYGATAADAVLTAVGNVANANELGVIGAMVAVDDPSYGPIVAAYNGLESSPCSVDAANGVASAIADLVDNLRTSNPTIENVVIVGGDEQIPQFRVPDEVYLSNENTYAATFGDLDDPISRAFDASYLFTDDPYGDPTPIDANGREVYVTEVALGRLVERPGEIVQALNHFITYNGLLDPASSSSAFVTGYDFLSDGAAAVAAQLDDTVPPRPVTLLNNDAWDRGILLPAWLNGLHSIMSINAHFDHNRAQPAATDTGTSTLGEGLVTVEDVIASGPDTLTRGVIFSMGCHAGLSVSDVQISGGPVDPFVGPAADALERDWAQTFAEQGAVLAANTGYGYGDTEAVALSELLMTYFADNLDGSMSVGEALQYAKHRYASGALLYGAFDDKVLMQATFYGLPMYAIGANPTTAPPVDPLPLGFDGVTGLTVASFDVDLGIGSDLVETTTPRGSFFSVDATTQVTPLRPIQPKVEIDATQPGDLIAHGALITALDSFDQEPFDPVVSKATVDLAANEPEPGVVGSFPSALQAVNRYQTKAGLRDQLVLVPGQFRNTSETEGVQRLFTNLEGFVFYSPIAETDFKVPTITEVTGTGSPLGITFDVEVTDTGSGVGRVYVLFKDPADFRWVGLDLAPNGVGSWSGTAVGASGLKDYFVQAVDLAGNVAVSSNKAELFVTGNVAPPPPLITVTGNKPGDWYVGSATVELDLPSGVSGFYDIDATGTFTPYSGPFVVTGDGPVEVVVQTSAGVFATVTLFIDDAPPIVVSSIEGATFVRGEIVNYAYE